MKKILVLNAGHSEIPLLEEVKELGYYLITSGNKPNEKGHLIGDKYIQADYSDKERILEIIKEENIDGIVSCAHDFGLETASYVAEKMGWKGHDSYENTMILHNKDSFKQLCVKLNIPSPLSVGFTDVDAALEYVEKVDYPIIVKAVDQASGVGISKAENVKEAIVAVENAFDKSKSKRIVVEPFIVGKQESINAFVRKGKVVSFVTCDSYSPLNPYLIQTETLMSENYEFLKDELVSIIEKIFAELNLVDGLITMQMIIKDGKPYIIEAMRRCLGNRYLYIAEAANGFPWHKALVMSELGMDTSILKEGTPKGNYVGHHAIMTTKNGVYKGTTIPDKVMEHVFDYIELMMPGEEIKDWKKERIGYIYYAYETREELDYAARHFNDLIEIEIE